MGRCPMDDTSPQLVTLVSYSGEAHEKKGTNDIQKCVHHMHDEYRLCNIKCPIFRWLGWIQERCNGLALS
jgi:hypothetical protein